MAALQIVPGEREREAASDRRRTGWNPGETWLSARLKGHAHTGDANSLVCGTLRRGVALMWKRYDRGTLCHERRDAENQREGGKEEYSHYIP